eukprot:Seg226.20 transcript_id=Seg226.20/GoldUCD/mRNA.D3Y31 product="THAP domain-containing protein 10" protein_id=Seg226.20/GoldUCD/D3Y31
MMENASDRSRVRGMEEKKRRGGRYCVAGGPGNTSCMDTSYSPAIKMHQFPKNPDVRQKWIKFLQKHRPSFKNPSKHASLCSAHFEESCYHRPLVLEDSTGVSWRRNFVQGSIPTRDSVNLASPKKLSARKKRQLIRHALKVLPKKRRLAVEVPSNNFENEHSSEIPMAGQDSYEGNADKSTMTMPVIQPHHKCKNCVRKSEKIKNLQRKFRQWKKLAKSKKKKVSGKKEEEVVQLEEPIELEEDSEEGLFDVDMRSDDGNMFSDENGGAANSLRGNLQVFKRTSIKNCEWLVRPHYVVSELESTVNGNFAIIKDHPLLNKKTSYAAAKAPLEALGAKLVPFNMHGDGYPSKADGSSILNTLVSDASIDAFMEDAFTLGGALMTLSTNYLSSPPIVGGLGG